MTIIDELKAKYPPDLVDQKLEEWKIQHPGESLEKLRVYLTHDKYHPRDTTTKNFEVIPCYECNERCIHCFNSEDDRRAKAPELEELYKHIDKMTIEKSVCVIGGEPTMRKDLVDVLKYIKEKGKKVNLHSNGVRFGDEKYLEKLIPYIDVFTLPIHSSDYDVFDSVTRVKGSADKTVKAFKNLVHIGRATIITQTVINRLNYKTLLGTFDMIQDISPNIRMMLTFPHPGGAAHSTDVVPRYSEVKDYIQPVLKKWTVLVDTRDIPRCYLYPYQDVVVKIDDERCNVGDLEIDHRRQSRIKSTDCKKCIFDKDCIGVWKEYGELYPEPDLVPVVQI
jgi:MoaA/NifB/PqqE/SkfB family radical SAM enzyme